MLQYTPGNSDGYLSQLLGSLRVIKCSFKYTSKTNKCEKQSLSWDNRSV